MYTWYDTSNDGFLETDRLWELLKAIWADRKYQFQVTWNKPPNLKKS